MNLFYKIWCNCMDSIFDKVEEMSVPYDEQSDIVSAFNSVGYDELVFEFKDKI